MRICIVGHFPPHIGGVSSYTNLLSQELVKRGDNVYVITYPYEKFYDKNSEIKKNLKVETAFAPDVKGLRGTIFTFTAFFKLIYITKKYKIDLIHAHYLLPPGLIGVLAGKLTKTSTAVTIHGSDIYRLGKNRILKSIIKFILKNTDHVYAVSSAAKKEALKFKIKGLKDKILITWNAVDIEKFNPRQKSSFKTEQGIEPKTPIILFVGNLVEQKGVKYLIESKKFIKYNCEIVIVGDGPLKTELKAVAKSEGLKNIKFVDARDDVHKILPEADVLVLPSISESFGIVLLEAMAAGVPVVATNVGGIPEIIADDVGILVEPKNAMAIGDAINRILSDPALSSNLSLNAQKKAKKYSKLEIPY